MLFHTVMIVLHRPPSHVFEKDGIAESEDVEICYESLESILHLMRSYSRFYRYRSLPLDFVHILSTTAGTIMMKRFFQNASWDDPNVERPLSLVIEAMEEIQNTWPCVEEIKDFVVQARQAPTSLPPSNPPSAPDLMNGLELGHGSNEVYRLSGLDEVEDDLGTLLTDEFLSTYVQLTERELEHFDFNIPPTGCNA